MHNAFTRGDRLRGRRAPGRRTGNGHGAVKLSALLGHLRKHGCVLKGEGASHSLWTNPANGATEAVPRHSEIPNILARKICQNPGIPEI